MGIGVQVGGMWGVMVMENGWKDKAFRVVHSNRCCWFVSVPEGPRPAVSPLLIKHGSLVTGDTLTSSSTLTESFFCVEFSK